jgi:hypothetical protein
MMTPWLFWIARVAFVVSIGLGLWMLVHSHCCHPGILRALFVSQMTMNQKALALTLADMLAEKIADNILAGI